MNHYKHTTRTVEVQDTAWQDVTCDKCGKSMAGLSGYYQVSVKHEIAEIYKGHFQGCTTNKGQADLCFDCYQPIRELLDGVLP